MGLVVRKCHFDVTACAKARRPFSPLGQPARFARRLENSPKTDGNQAEMRRIRKNMLLIILSLYSPSPDINKPCCDKQAMLPHHPPSPKPNLAKARLKQLANTTSQWRKKCTQFALTGQINQNALPRTPLHPRHPTYLKSSPFKPFGNPTGPLGDPTRKFGNPIEPFVDHIGHVRVMT